LLSSSAVILNNVLIKGLCSRFTMPFASELYAETTI